MIIYICDTIRSESKLDYSDGAQLFIDYKI